MSKIKSLEKYTAALLEIAAYQKSHKKVFEEADSLKVKLQEAEAELKKDIKDNIKKNIANNFVRATYSQAFSKTYDIAVILKKINPKQKKELVALKAIVETTTIDGEKLDEAIEKDIIPVAVKQAAFVETELSPRVSIKEVTE